MKHFKIADDFSLPADALTQTFALLARRGAGKTYAAKVLAEEFVTAGFPIVVLDPVGVWFGLRAGADGSPRNGLGVVILGGDHGDVPLEPSAGKVIADFLVNDRVPCILDLSRFGEAEMQTFVADFAERYYRTNSEPVHWFVDEADEFAPQEARGGGPLWKCLGAMQRVIRRGRARGIGCTLITQRSAVINKSVLTQTECLIALQTTAPQDLAAIEEWLKYHAAKELRTEIMNSLPGLQQGEAIMYSPGWLRELKRLKFRKLHTFDSSRTPKPGEHRKTPKGLADVDLAGLTKKVAATIERAKAEDPKELRKQIAELKKERDALKTAQPAAPKTKTEIKRVEVPAIKQAELKRLETAIERMAKAGEQIVDAATFLSDRFNDMAKIAQQAHAEQLKAIEPPATMPQWLKTPASQRPPRKPVQTYSKPHSNGAPPREGITPRQQRFLDSAATLTTLATEVTRETIAAWNGIHPRTGSYGEDLKALADAGLIVNDRGAITVTEAGMNAAAQLDPAEAIDRAKSGLSNRQRNFFEMIVAEYPNQITREAIAEAFNLHPRTGSFGEDLSALVKRGLVDGGRGVYRARDFLFAG